MLGNLWINIPFDFCEEIHLICGIKLFHSSTIMDDPKVIFQQLRFGTHSGRSSVHKNTFACQSIRKRVPFQLPTLQRVGKVNGFTSEKWLRAQ